MFETQSIQDRYASLVYNIEIISNANQSSLRIPANCSELYIPIDGNLTFKGVGQARSQVAKEGVGYFFHSRSRGLMLDFDNAKSCVILKINSIYQSSIVNSLDMISSIVSELRLTGNTYTRLYKAAKIGSSCLCDKILSELIYPTRPLDNKSSFESGAELIRQARGQITIKDIYTTLDISKSKLEQDFMKSVGITPKEYCKIEKLNHFVNSYYDSQHSSLTELTYQCGYYDQSHLIKDFNYFLDISPRRYFDLKRA